MTTKKLLIKLVAIPSYYQAGINDEVKYTEFIETYLHRQKYLKNVRRQFIDKKRYNLLIDDGRPIKLLFACHLDTTPPKDQKKYRPFLAKRVGDRLYGLGTKDMKGGTACLLRALQNFKSTKGLGLLFYVDEENELAGMKTFVAKGWGTKKFKPQLIISPESRLAIGHGNRGIVGVKFVVKGQTAHSARPQEGINAILVAMRAFEKLSQKISRLSHRQLGQSVANLSFLRGGMLQDEKNGLRELARRMNVVPDLAEIDISMRTSRPELNAQMLIKEFKKNVSKLGASVIDCQISHDYRAAYIDRSKLKPLAESIKEAGLPVVWGKIKNKGYNDVAMITEKFGSPYANFGPRGEANHTPDEYVELGTLEPTVRVFENLIKKMCNGS